MSRGLRRRRSLVLGVLVLMAFGGCSSETVPVDDGTGGHAAAGGAAGQGGAGGMTSPCGADLQSDPAHCGACDRACAPGQLCEAGQCVCEPGVVAPDFASELLPVFESSCDGSQCHQGPRPKVGLDLVSDPHGALVGVVSFECGAEMRLLVEPGHPERSYVLDKLRGVGICSGTRMPPPPAAALDAATIRVVSDWICAGAPP